MPATKLQRPGILFSSRRCDPNVDVENIKTGLDRPEKLSLIVLLSPWHVKLKAPGRSNFGIGVVILDAQATRLHSWRTWLADAVPPITPPEIPPILQHILRGKKCNIDLLLRLERYADAAPTFLPYSFPTSLPRVAIIANLQHDADVHELLSFWASCILREGGVVAGPIRARRLRQLCAPVTSMP